MKKIIEEEPNNIQICYELVHLYARRGLISEVIDMYLKISDIYFQQLDQEKRLEVCKKILELDPESIRAREKIIEIYEDLGNKDAVREHCFSLSKICTMVGEVEKALGFLKKGIEVDPDNLDAHLELAGMNVKQGNIKEGILQYKEVARAFREKDELARAADIYKRVTILQPDNTEIHMALGLIYKDLGELEKAKNEFRFILRYNLSHIKALRELGLVCEEKGEVDSAILAFRKIVDLDREDILAKVRLGDLYEVRGQREQALREYCSAAEAYVENGRKSEAIEICEMILRLEPTYIKATRLLKSLVTYITKADPIDNKLIESFEKSAEKSSSFDTSDMEDEQSKHGESDMEDKISPDVKGEDEKIVGPSVKEMEDDGPAAFPEFIFLDEDKSQAEAGGEEKIAKKIEDDEERLIEFSPSDETSNKSSQFLEIEEYRKAIKENPRDIKNRAGLAQVLFKAGLLKEAAEEYENILKIAENDIDIYCKIIDIYNLLGQKEDLRIKYLALGELYRKNSSYDEALDIYQRLLALNKEDTLARENLSQILLVMKGQEERSCSDAGERKEAETTHRDTSVLDESNVLSNLAETLIENGLLKEAAEEYEKLLKLDEGNIDIFCKIIDIYNLIDDKEELRKKYLKLGEVYKNRDDYSSALDTYQRLIALNSEDFEAREYMAHILFMQNKRKEAVYQYVLIAGIYEAGGETKKVIDIYEKMLEIEPMDLITHNKLAEAYSSLSMKDKAIEEYLIIADLYLAKKLWHNAIEVYEKITAIDAEYLDAHMKLSELYMKSGMSDKAIFEILVISDVYTARQEFDRAIEMVKEIIGTEAEHIKAREKLLDIYIKKGLKDRAFSEYESLAEIFLNKNDVDKALWAYEEMVKLEPERCETYYKLADIYKKSGNTAMAVNKYMSLAGIFQNRNEYDKAMEIYRDILLKLDPNHIESRYEMAVLLAEKRKDISGALEEFEFIARTCPHNTETLHRLVDCYIETEDVDKAVKLAKNTGSKEVFNRLVLHYKGLIDINPKDYEARYILGVVYKESGNLGKCYRAVPDPS